MINLELAYLLSQLADGELSADEANRVLLGMLDDPASRQELKSILRSRQSLAAWRLQQPSRVVLVVPESAAVSRQTLRRSFGVVILAAAAMLGGILVAGVLYLSDRYGNRNQLVEARLQKSAPSIDHGLVKVVTPAEQKEIEQAFALHESVVGSLSWYVADDANIHVAPARTTDATQAPIAIILRLASAEPCGKKTAKTYVVVCRDNDSAVIDLPEPKGATKMHLRLLSTVTKGTINIRYALAAGGSDGEMRDPAILAGERRVGLNEISLGQVAMQDCLINLDAAAWVIPSEVQ